MTDHDDISGLDFDCPPSRVLTDPDSPCHVCSDPVGDSVYLTVRCPEDWRPGDWMPTETPTAEEMRAMIAAGWKVLTICDRCRREDEPRSQEFRERLEIAARARGRRPPA